jgi:hypothetical protein
MDPAVDAALRRASYLYLTTYGASGKSGTVPVWCWYDGTDAYFVRQQGAPRRVEGLFLCYLGVRTFLARLADRAARAGGAGLLGAFTATFGLTLATPATILSFVAVFAGLGIAGAGSWREAAVPVAGVFAGSALWWLMLSGGVAAP